MVAIWDAWLGLVLTSAVPVPPTCAHAYFGLPAEVRADPAALRTAVLRRYPVGTAGGLSVTLRKAALDSTAACTAEAEMRFTGDSGYVERLVLRPRRGAKPAPTTAELRWNRAGLADARVALGAPPPSAVPAVAARSEPPRPAPADGEYRPAARLRSGNAVVVLFISSSWCGANLDTTFVPTVKRVMRTVAAQAARAGRPVEMIGVSLDWSAREGVQYLEQFGTFDQLAAGGNWLNVAAVNHMWRDGDAKPVVPQIVVLERQVDAASTPGAITFGGDRVLGRYWGPGEIRKLAEQGIALGPVQ